MITSLAWEGRVNPAEYCTRWPVSQFSRSWLYPAPINPDQDRLAGSAMGEAGELVERLAEHGDVIVGGVGAGVAGS